MRALIATLCWLVLASSCSSSQTSEANHGELDDEIAQVARQLREAALKAEPQTTTQLTALSKQVSGRLAGLDNRIKTEASLIRKITARLADESKKRTLETVDIVDSLRYTLVVDDSPEGHYVRSATLVLTALENSGVEVVRVKNYWPRGDNYSGVNVVLRNPDGFQWEIQFHTSGSLEIRDEWYTSYTRLRDQAIGIDERRRIFDQMAPPWEQVDIPVGVLDPKNLHDTERIILYPRP